MGMYTQLHLGAQLKKDTPQPVIDVLSFMFGERETHPEPLPDHALFRTPRWSLMLRCDSYYFDYKTTHHFEKDDIAGQFWLNVTTNLKNYESEIEAFMDWITPYLDAMPGDFLGYSRYEEEQQPTLLFMPESPRAVAAVDPDAGGIPMTTPEQPEQETLAEAHLDDLLLCQQILAADMTMQPDTEPLPTPNRSIPVGTVAFALYGAIQELRSHRKELASIHKLARVEGIEEAVSNAALGDVQRILKLTTARASLRRELKQAEADLAAVRAELAQVKQGRQMCDSDAERYMTRANQEIANRERSQIYASRCEIATASMALKLEAADQQLASLRGAVETLKGYVQHKLNCAINITRHADDSAAYLSEKCDCGLARLLSPEGSREQEKDDVSRMDRQV